MKHQDKKIVALRGIIVVALILGVLGILILLTLGHQKPTTVRNMSSAALIGLNTTSCSGGPSKYVLSQLEAAALTVSNLTYSCIAAVSPPMTANEFRLYVSMYTDNPGAPVTWGYAGFLMNNVTALYVADASAGSNTVNSTSVPALVSDLGETVLITTKPNYMYDTILNRTKSNYSRYSILNSTFDGLTYSFGKAPSVKSSSTYEVEWQFIAAKGNAVVYISALGRAVPSTANATRFDEINATELAKVVVADLP